jgi:hypothetical protein
MTQTAEQELLLSIKLHSFPAEVLKEFAEKIVKPYFGGNLNQAIRSLMEKTLTEEVMFNQALKAHSKLRLGRFPDGFEIASP